MPFPTLTAPLLQDDPYWIDEVRTAAVVADLDAEHEARAMWNKPLSHLTESEAETLTEFLREGEVF